MDDILSDLEKQASGDSGDVGETTETTPSGLDLVMDVIPSQDLKAFTKWTATYRISPDDPFYGSVLAARIAYSGAAAAGEAAQRVTDGLQKIPNQIYHGAIQAGQEIKGQLGQEIQARTVAAGAALVQAIGKSANQGAAAIGAASMELIGKLDEAVEVKKQQGVDAFAQAAAGAALAAARAAGAKRFLWSLSGVALLLVIFLGFGGAGAWEFLDLTHRIAPAPLVLNAAGKPNCGQITVGGQRQEVCEIR